ncbi:1-acyl-sn-glycerol-3-phosphate acyltransferase [Gammaproteobacteria bacterium]|nr:1-acyl-sn-glycerol-3-phosphate acyltransferase [Gammaproteobacteria bacterium]
MDPFLAIRPYQDHEVQPVLSSLIEDPAVLKALISLKYSKYFNKLPFFTSLVKILLKSQVKNIHSIEGYQEIFKSLMDQMIKTSISNLEVEGISNLDSKSQYLFISNHRDISLDAALLNLSLNRVGHKTFNMAVGNNLMKEKWASDLMRLNKSFIIQRSGNKKEIYMGLSLASQFIQHTILEAGESIWIAQKQGRAKDGIDETDPAMLKMIHLTERKTQSLGQYFNALKVVPVSISYELDPNDCLKAIELNALDQNKNYEKSENEDLISIANGINGQKGNVTINVGQPILCNDIDSYEVVANKISKEITSMYYLHPTNFAAASMLETEHQCIHQFTDEDISEAKDLLSQRMANLDDGARLKFLNQYANPVIQKSSSI